MKYVLYVCPYRLFLDEIEEKMNLDNIYVLYVCMRLSLSVCGCAFLFVPAYGYGGRHAEMPVLLSSVTFSEIITH